MRALNRLNRLFKEELEGVFVRNVLRFIRKMEDGIYGGRGGGGGCI